MTNDVIAFLTATYKFSVRPIIPANTAPFSVANLVYQSGELMSGDNKLPIIQLLVGSNFEIVTSSSTETADIILDDYMARMDEKFKFRFAEAQKQRVYQSNVIIEFAGAFEDKIEAFRKIETILTETSGNNNQVFKMKRLAFGYGDIQQQIMTVEDLARSDFVIDRRAGEPFQRNRFFSSAPFTTAKHIEILEKIEKVLG